MISFRCVGEVRKLAAGGGHSAVLTDACSLKELCEFRLADTVNLQNASEIEDVASRTGSDALARLCGRLRFCTSMYILVYICNQECMSSSSLFACRESRLDGHCEFEEGETSD